MPETVDQQVQKLAQRGDTAAAYTIAFINRLKMVYGDKWEDIYETLYANGGKDESYQASDDETKLPYTEGTVPGTKWVSYTAPPTIVSSRNTKFPGLAPVTAPEYEGRMFRAED